jgi:hypothetical protein
MGPPRRRTGKAFCSKQGSLTTVHSDNERVLSAVDAPPVGVGVGRDARGGGSCSWPRGVHGATRCSAAVHVKRQARKQQTINEHASLFDIAPLSLVSGASERVPSRSTPRDGRQRDCSQLSRARPAARSHVSCSLRTRGPRGSGQREVLGARGGALYISVPLEYPRRSRRAAYSPAHQKEMHTMCKPATTPHLSRKEAATSTR